MFAFGHTRSYTNAQSKAHTEWRDKANERKTRTRIRPIVLTWAIDCKWWLFVNRIEDKMREREVNEAKRNYPNYPIGHQAERKKYDKFWFLLLLLLSFSFLNIQNSIDCWIVYTNSSIDYYHRMSLFFLEYSWQINRFSTHFKQNSDINIRNNNSSSSSKQSKITHADREEEMFFFFDSCCWYSFPIQI